MLTVKTIKAVGLNLLDDVEAVLVQDGEPWNGFREFRCVAPQEFAGQRVITIDEDESKAFGRFLNFFDDILEFQIVMTSPAIGDAIKKARAAAKEGAAAPEAAATDGR